MLAINKTSFMLDSSINDFFYLKLLYDIRKIISLVFILNRWLISYLEISHTNVHLVYCLLGPICSITRLNVKVKHVQHMDRT